jgi:hypothetical protein
MVALSFKFPVPEEIEINQREYLKKIIKFQNNLVQTKIGRASRTLPLDGWFFREIYKFFSFHFTHLLANDNRFAELIG